MKIWYILLVFVSCTTSLPALAQTTTSLPVSSPTPGQQRAAEALLNTIYSEESFGQVIDNVMTSQLKLHPELQRYEGEMRAFMHKYMSYAALKPDLATLYTREFSELELNEIARFYQSPVGKKAAVKLPIMMQAGMEIGQRHVREHLPELQKIFESKQAADSPQPTED